MGVQPFVTSETTYTASSLEAFGFLSQTPREYESPANAVKGAPSALRKRFWVRGNVR